MAGISYAYWNCGLNLNTLVNTGDLKVQFDPNVEYEVLNGACGLKARFVDEHTLYVEGTVEEAVGASKEETKEGTIIRPVYSDFEGIVKLGIVNAGSVPAKLADRRLDVSSGQVELSPDTQQDILLPKYNQSGSHYNPDIKIHAGEGKVEFQAEFLFNQPE